VIDDERLQELLAKASTLYHNGEYKGAIEAWHEALTVDPASQKAKEGIRMATLLLGDWEPQASGPSAGPDPTTPADGGSEPDAETPPEEIEARLDLGIARVKQLLSQRKYSEAIEGAQGLLPLSPDSEEVQRLLEEAQQAFESSPFIEEHLTLARELFAQERYAEAETECEKVFVLDAAHPDAQALLAEIRSKAQRNLARAASQLGGMTVKLNAAEIAAARPRKAPGKAAASSAAPSRPTAPAGPPQAVKPPAAPSKPEAGVQGTSFGGEVMLDAGDEPSVAMGGAGAPAPTSPDEADGEAAARQEEVAARSRLESAFEQAGVADAETLPEAQPFELAEGGIAPGSAAPPAAAEPQVVEARTVVPSSVRAAPRSPAPAGPKDVKPAVSPGPPASSRPAGKPQPPAADGTANWETELTKLNLKVGERTLLKGMGAKAGGSPVEPGPEEDLMSLLDTDLGGPAPASAGGAKEPSSAGPASIPLATAAPAQGKDTKGSVARPRREPALQEALGEDQAEPAATPRARPSARPRGVASPGPRSGSAGSKLLVMLLLLLLAGGAAWFFFKPQAIAGLAAIRSMLPIRSAGGPGSPDHPVAPPAGSSLGATLDPGQSAIPTPIGGGNRQGSQTVQSSEGQGAAGAGAPGAGAPGRDSPAGGAPAPAAHPSGAAVAGTSAPGPAAPGAVARNTASEGMIPIGAPIKPETQPNLPKEEIHRRVSAYTADGRRLVAAGRWREARAKLNAALALDPANLEVKDLADQTQAKLEDEQHLQDEFDSVKKLFEEKDFEKALFKLYRLPRDRGLGNIDLYIQNGWYDWAAVLLKAGNPTDCLKKLSEALDLRPEDDDALKMQEVAERYRSRAKDKTYWAFCESLKLRPFDHK